MHYEYEIGKLRGGRKSDIFGAVLCAIALGACMPFIVYVNPLVFGAVILIGLLCVGSAITKTDQISKLKQQRQYESENRTRGNSRRGKAFG